MSITIDSNFLSEICEAAADPLPPTSPVLQYRNTSNRKHQCINHDNDSDNDLNASLEATDLGKDSVGTQERGESAAALYILSGTCEHLCFGID